MMLKNIISPRLNRASRRQILPDLPPSPQIAKIIHQTYPHKVLPPELQRNVDRIRELNPDWEYRLYDDSDVLDFVRREYGSVVCNYFQRISPRYGAARADLFRYLVIYRFGGAYFDIKSMPSRPLSEVIRDDDSYLVSYWNKNCPADWKSHDELAFSSRGEFQQWHLVAAAGHPILKSVLGRILANIDLYNPVLHGVGKKGTLRLTGPIAYTLALRDELPHHAHRLVDADEDLGFRYNIFDETGHEAMFKSHYSTLTEPIVKVAPLRLVLGKIVVAMRRAKRTSLTKAIPNAE